jgi:hypothetical protein
VGIPPFEVVPELGRDLLGALLDTLEGGELTVVVQLQDALGQTAQRVGDGSRIMPSAVDLVADRFDVRVEHGDADHDHPRPPRHVGALNPVIDPHPTLPEVGLEGGR